MIRRLLQIILPLFLALFASAEGQIPEYAGEMSVILNDNVPAFAPEEVTDQAFVVFSPLDDLGRAGVAFACLGPETPVGAASSIRKIQPSGWRSVIIASVPGAYLFNRCHLIARRFLSDADANENLITGTQAMNHGPMLVIEGAIAKYINQTEHHVMYRVTPWFWCDELICRGVEIEAQSVEDGEISLHVFCFNVQPGIIIDYKTGEAKEETP